MVVIDGIEWDYGPDDNIEYFDPDKSYWITKYRPINKTKGLDFNPDWFREDAIQKLTKGNYSGIPSARYGGKMHRDFWKERLRRCEVGYESHGYRVTGDNYFWLNFYRLKQSKEGGQKTGTGRSLSFPLFFVYQYEYFHYVDLCETLKKDVGLLKSRGIGFSEAGAALCARPFITTPNYRVVASAFSDRHLKPLLSKIWAQLDWLNMETENAFKRIRMVINTNMYKRASKKDTNGNEFGHMAEIEGIVADSAEKIRGDRTERLFYEEAGSDKIFEKKWIQGEALVQVLGEKVGTRIGWGTGGDEGTSIEGITLMASNPEAFNILPFKNTHTLDGTPIFSSMFIPCYVTLKEAMDNRGWCDPELGRAHYDKERAKKATNAKGLLMYKAEYCYTIEEALILGGSNLFPREELAQQEANISIYKTVELPTNGHLTWNHDDSGRLPGVKWRFGDDGKIWIKEHPIIAASGNEYKNLYVGGIDSIDLGVSDSSDGDKGSDFCIVIKKRVFGQSDPYYVAMYKDRPRNLRDAYENAAKLLTYYGCQAVLESTRTAILTYFRDNGYLNLLMKRPRSTMPDIAKGNSNMYGTPATVKVIDHYRELIYDFILDYSHTMSFLEMVQQLLRYSDEKKKEFDIVAAMGMAELGDEELSARRPSEREPDGAKFSDIGWFKDSKGYKHYGRIPKTQEERNAKTRIGGRDSWLYEGAL